MPLTTNKTGFCLDNINTIRNSVTPQLSEQLYQKSQDIIPTDFYKF